MKSLKTALFSLAIIVTGTVFSQSAQDYSALAEFLPAEKLTHLQNAEGETYAEVAFLNRHGYHLAETGAKDFSMFPHVSEVTSIYPGQPPITLDMISSGELNLIAYNFKPKRENYTYFRIAGTDKVLVIPPTKLTFERRIQE